MSMGFCKKIYIFSIFAKSGRKHMLLFLIKKIPLRTTGEKKRRGTILET